MCGKNCNQDANILSTTSSLTAPMCIEKLDQSSFQKLDQLTA